MPSSFVQGESIWSDILNTTSFISKFLKKKQNLLDIRFAFAKAYKQRNETTQDNNYNLAERTQVPVAARGLKLDSKLILSSMYLSNTLPILPLPPTAVKPREYQDEYRALEPKSYNEEKLTSNEHPCTLYIYSGNLSRWIFWHSLFFNFDG